MAESLAIIGGVASFAQILIVVASTIDTFAILYSDFQDAPSELLRVQTKLRLLKSYLEEFKTFLLAFPDNVVLPPDLRQLIWEAVSQVQSDLIAIQGICKTESRQTLKSFRARLRWASFGKKSMSKMTQHLKKSEDTLNAIIQFVTFRHTAFIHQTMMQLDATRCFGTANRLDMPLSISCSTRDTVSRSMTLGLDSWIRRLGLYGKFLFDSTTANKAWRFRICIGYCPPSWLCSGSVSFELELSRLITGTCTFLLHPIRLQNRVPLDSPFMTACMDGDIRLIQQLIEDKSADVSDRTICSGKTPLLLAIEGEHLEAMRVLLEKGADPNIGDDDQILPTLAVAGYNPRRNKPLVQVPPTWVSWLDALELLVRHGASIHETAQNRPISTFHLFGGGYEPDTLRFFRLLASENYNDFNACFGPPSLSAVQTAIGTKQHAAEALRLLHKQGVNFNRIGNDGRTLLHLAAEIARDGDVLDYLCSINGLADINKRDKWGRTPLHYSVLSEYLGHCSVPLQNFRYLLGQGADHKIKGGGVHCAILKTRHPDLTPLEFAASLRRPPFVDEFISALEGHVGTVSLELEDENFVDASEYL